MRPSSRQVSQKAMVARQRPVTQRPPVPMKRPGRRSLARILALSGSEAFFLASAFCFTVEVSSSIEAAVSSRLAACCSVRRDRSLLPEAISPAA
ncbi:hypothetical protein EN796_033205, partial [Mesorhizobium sp. M2D.F.Ca.ET.153.01.1.1]